MSFPVELYKYASIIKKIVGTVEPGTGDMAKTTYDNAGIEEQVVGIDATQDVSNKTFINATLNSPVLVTPNLGTPSVLVLTNATSGTNKNLMTDAEVTKLGGIEAGADVTDAANVGSSLNGAAAKTTLVDADVLSMLDSAASNALKKITWANFKTALFALTGVIPTAMLIDNAVGNAKSAKMPLGTVKVNNTTTPATGNAVDMLLPPGTILYSDATGLLRPGVLGDKFSQSGADINVLPPSSAEVLGAAAFVLVDGDPTNEAGTKLNTVPAYTWATIPLASANADKWIYVTDLFGRKCLLYSNGTRWLPSPNGGEIDIFRGNWGTMASPTLSRTTVGKYNIGTDPVIPAGLLAVGDEIELLLLINAHGTAAGSDVVRVHLGTNGTPTSNSLLYGITPAVTVNNQNGFGNPVATVVDATHYITTSRLVKGGLAGAAQVGLIEDQTTNFNIASAMTMTVNLTTNDSGEAMDVMSFRAIWRPKPS